MQYGLVLPARRCYLRRLRGYGYGLLSYALPTILVHETKNVVDALGFIDPVPTVGIVVPFHGQAHIAQKLLYAFSICYGDNSIIRRMGQKHGGCLDRGGRRLFCVLVPVQRFQGGEKTALAVVLWQETSRRCLDLVGQRHPAAQADHTGKAALALGKHGGQGRRKSLTDTAQENTVSGHNRFFGADHLEDGRDALVQAGALKLGLFVWVFDGPHVEPLRHGRAETLGWKHGCLGKDPANAGRHGRDRAVLVLVGRVCICTGFAFKELAGKLLCVAVPAVQENHCVRVLAAARRAVDDGGSHLDFGL